ncbi:MAG: hypothetical protein E6Q97_23065 [Desulfurellales bacterium]|nr:MAG: hypothetical protein E6Q97_23065 [Desulfurellales bacterium]
MINATPPSISPSGYAKKRIRDNYGNIVTVDDPTKPIYQINGQSVSGLPNLTAALNYVKAQGGVTINSNSYSYAGMTDGRGQPNQGKHIDARPKTTAEDAEAKQQNDFNAQFHDPAKGQPAAGKAPPDLKSFSGDRTGLGVLMDPALLPSKGGGATLEPNMTAPGARFQFGMGRPDDGRRIDASIPHGADNFGHQFDGSMPFGGYRAAGGPVDPNKAYLVGENGPEMVVPQTAATVVPADRTQEYIDKIGKAATEARLREADRLRQMTPAPQNDPAAMPQQTQPPMIFGVGRLPDTGAPDRITSMPFGKPDNKPVSQPWDSPMLFGAPPEVAAPPAPAVPTLEDMRFRGLAARARLDNARYDEMRFGRPDSDFPQPHTGATPPPRNGTIFDLGRKPTQPALPDYVEQNMRGLTGSQKRAVRNQAGMQMGQQQFQEELSLDKQAKAAVGAWEAAKATRETMGLPPISPELDKQFWNGNVQKQLAMVQQMGILTDEHLKQRHGEQQVQQRQAETADERAYRQSLTADERRYAEEQDRLKAQEHQKAASQWTPIPNSSLQMNGLAQIASTNGKGFSMEDAQKAGLEIDSIDSEGKARWKRPENRAPVMKDLYNGDSIMPQTLQYNRATGQWEPPVIATPSTAPNAPATGEPAPARTRNAPPAGGVQVSYNGKSYSFPDAVAAAKFKEKFKIT